MRLESEITQLKQIVQRIETAIIGNEEAGIEGLVKKVNKHEKKIELLQRYAWIGIGIVLILGTVLNLYNKLI